MKWLLVWAGTAVTVARVWAQAELEYECTLSSPVEVGDGVFLQQVKNSAAGTFTMQLSYTGGQAWVGIGVNTEGTSKMTPGQAVIGRVEQDGSTSVLQYAMTTDSKDGSGVLPLAQQKLIEARFEQTDTDSTLTFTQMLTDNDAGIDITDDSSWIFAVGLPDNQWEGKHTIYGSFFLPLSENCVRITRTPTESPTKSPSKSPTDSPMVSEAQAVPLEPDTSSGLQDQEDAEQEPLDEEAQAGEVTLDMEQQVESAVTPSQPEQQQQMDSTALNNTTTTTTTSTSAPTTIAISPSGPSSATTSGLVMRADPTERTHLLWVAHGWTLALAWGIVAPMAVGAAILRKTVGRYANWYHLHFYLNLLVVLLTSIGFVLAVVAIGIEDKPHFPLQDDSIHHPAGLAIFIIVLLQALVGYLRPAAPVPPAPSAAKFQTKDSETGTNLDAHSPKQTDHCSSLDDQSDENDQSHSSIPPSFLRTAWELQHRLTGTLLIAFAWYNCHSGFQLMDEKYQDSDNDTTIFWGVTGAIAGTIFVASYVAKLP